MTSFQVQQWLREGIAAAKSGQIARARDVLMQVVNADEYNEQGWLWLSSVVDTDADREICLENVLSINPENKLAKSGLVHLRNRRLTAAALPPAPEPEPAPQPPAPSQGMKAMPTGWWSQPQPSQPTLEPDVQDRLSAAATPVKPTVEPAAEPAKAPQKERRRREFSLRPAVIAICLLLGLGAATVAALALLRIGPFNPGDQTYIQAMRPLLEKYDNWWAGPYGALVGELNSLCGPDADGWTNRDVLVVCSQQPALDCSLLAAHCGTDIEAMRERVSTLSSQAQTAGNALFEELTATLPPDDVAVAHRRFLDCLRSQIDAAGQAEMLARGELSSELPVVPACQIFPAAEQEVWAYVGRE
jgi:hypothetical protein